MNNIYELEGGGFSSQSSKEKLFKLEERRKFFL